MHYILAFIALFNPLTVGVMVMIFHAISYVVHRISFAVRLRAFCRRNGISFCAHRLFWYFGNFRHKTCEFSLSTSRGNYAVKLVGVRSKAHFINLTEEHSYSIHKKDIGASPRMSMVIVAKPVIKEMPEYEFFSKTKSELAVKRILLFYPASISVKLQKSHSHENNELFCGDAACQNTTFYTLDGFMEHLKSEL